MTTEKITFNDLPKAVAQVLEKISDLEINVSVLREEIQNGPSKAKDHVPMKIEEACEFLQMKKATMYYHLQHGSVPATRTGKCYIFFKAAATMAEILNVFLLLALPVEALKLPKVAKTQSPTHNI